MPEFKYFRKIKTAQEADKARPDAPLPLFDFASLGTQSRLKQGISRFLLRRLLPFLSAILRVVCPSPRFGRFVLVTRRADVETVLRAADDFRVVYDLEMEELGAGHNNVLGEDGERHSQLRKVLSDSLGPDDFLNVRTWVEEDTNALLDAGGGRIDVFRDLVTRTATEASCRLFGLDPLDRDTFAEWTMAVSNQLFGDFFGDPNIRQQSQSGAAHLRAVIDDAIDRVEANNRHNSHSTRQRVTLIDRLITDMGRPREEVRATILGLITAFVPTNTLAAGNILEVLLDNGSLMWKAIEAAKKNDRDGVQEVLLEAGARNPALSPGLWRHRPQGTSEIEIGSGWLGRRTIRPGDLVLACIPSALRQKGVGEHSDAWLMFGHGPHVCFGDALALEHLTSVFTALLARQDLERARGKFGRMDRVGPFPVRMDMTFSHSTARRALMVLQFPVNPEISSDRVRTELKDLGNPAKTSARTSLEEVPLQFASLSVIERTHGSHESILLLELSGDGDEQDLLRAFANSSYHWLASVLAFCSDDQQPPADQDTLFAVLQRGLIHVHFKPWGATGLHFDGLPELSVEDIERQEKIAKFATIVVNNFVERGVDLSARAMDVLQRTQRLIRRDSFLMLRPSNRRLRNNANLATSSITRPNRRRLSIADWRPHRSIFGPVPAMLTARGNRPLLGSIIALWLFCLIALTVWLGPDRTAPWWEWWLVAPIPLFIGSIVMLVVSIASAFGIFLALVRWHELREPSDLEQAPLKKIEAMAEIEDRSGYAQNHITAVMPFKKGLLRRLSFAFAMWGIAQTVTHWFRPGFVLTMGTIHKARWFRVPGTDQFVFFSNYDGSWESYLEDFITRAHEGQTAAWSHGVGFPPTKFLIGDGARDGDRFKRWVRKQQRETSFWYTRFPNLTAEQIRNNAMIEDGLARATTDTDARRWLSLFGSTQRPQEELEVQEVQSLVFSGFPQQKLATALTVRLPDDRFQAGLWVSAISGQRAPNRPGFIDPPKEWLVDRNDLIEIEVPLDGRIRFGESPVGNGGATFGLTASGLRKLGFDDACGYESLPPVFRMTMANRGRLVGDDPAMVASWRVTDDPERENGADAILIIYGTEYGTDHSTLVHRHEQLLQYFGGQITHQVPCSPVRDDRLDVEHFGFRDGISQPVIKGTSRASQEVPERDQIAAGEFILGYPNGQGFNPPPISVGTENDIRADLPAVRASQTNRFPWFGPRPKETEWRDFGRNGSFLAVRQLDQDISGFEDETVRIACQLNKLNEERSELSELVGSPIDKDWVAAKIVGRWQDGTPLVGHPTPRSGHTAGEPDRVDNDFTYGRDDPRGLECPLGSHIRRANPRDSKEAGDSEEQDITNRHRLLRRGRAYSYTPDDANGETRTGLLFMALCADLERQFEFVQRSWLNATSFHGLVSEVDPLLGGDRNDKSAGNRGFTIPTSAGPVKVRVGGEILRNYVETRGGGYFFLASRSALRFLIRRSQSGVIKS